VTDRQKLIAGILSALPALLLACTAWVQADAAKREKEAAYESYGEYVTDQLHRDEALLKALRDCQVLLKTKPALWMAYSMEDVPEGVAVAGVAKAKDWAEAAATPEPQAQAVLDEIARRGGWETKEK
jgi:hypothetical protein